MNDPQKLVAGALLAGAGLLTGEATLLAVAGGIGVNWSGEALAGLLRTFPSQPGEPLARAYARAIRRAVDDLRQQYPHTGNACTLLPAFDLVAACAGEIGAAHLPPVLPATLEPGAIQSALAAGLDGLLFGHGEAEVAFLRRHLLPAVARAFAAELDGDDRAWRRYHGWLIEQTAAAFVRFAAQPPAIAPAVAPAIAPPVAPAPAAAEEDDKAAKAAEPAEPAAPAPASLPDLVKLLAALADAEAVHARLAAAIARLEALYAGWLAALERSPGGPSAAFDNRGVQANTLVQGAEAYHQSARAEGGGTATVINISGAALPPGALADLLAGKAGQLPAGAPATGGQAAGGQVTGAPAAGARPLSGAQLGELHAALLGTFTPDSLRQMVAFHLDESLDAIAGGPNFSAVVFALLDWAQRHGRLPELLAGAHAAVPGNARLTDALRAAGMAG